MTNTLTSTPYLHHLHPTTKSNIITTTTTTPRSLHHHGNTLQPPTPPPSPPRHRRHLYLHVTTSQPPSSSSHHLTAATTRAPTRVCLDFQSPRTDGEAMINSIQNGDQPLPVIAQVSLVGNAQNVLPTIKDQKQMRGFEYGEQDRKAAILYKYETFKAIEGEQLLDTYLRYLKVINDLKKCGYKKDNCDVNDALGYKKKAIVITSDPLALVDEKTKVSKRKEKVVVSLDFEGSGEDDFSILKKIIALLAKAFNQRKFYSKLTNNNLRTSSTSQSANKKQEVVKSDDKKDDKKANDKKRDMSKVKCYNCKKEGHFAKDCNKAKEINAKMVFIAHIEKVLSKSDESSSYAEETITEVAYYTFESESEYEFETSEYYDNFTNYGLFVNNDDDQEIFHDAIESASETFIENHIDSQKTMIRIGFENPSYFEKAKDLRPMLYDEKVIGLGYTLMFLTHSDEALEIEKFKRARENKIKFAYDYGNLNASYVNEKINFLDDYFQEIINPDFEKIDSPFQQTSSLKLYVSNFILEKIIIDLEDEVKKKGSSNTSNVDLFAVSLLNLNKNVKRYSRKHLMSCNNSHLGDTSSAYVCNDAMNVSCNPRLCDLFDENNLFIFDDESVRISPVSKMPFRKKPHDSLNVHYKCNLNKSLPRTVHRWLPKMQPLAEPVAKWIPRVERRIDKNSKTPNSSGPIYKWVPKHMTGNRALLTKFVEKFLGTVRFGHNDFAVIAGYGDVSTRFVRNKDGVDLLIGDRSLNLYTIALYEVASNSSTCLLAKASSLQSWLWHQHLSHLNFTTINNLMKNNLVQGLSKMKFEKDHLCSACEQGKIHWKHHMSKMDFASNKTLYLLHMDFCGPMRIKSINGKRYVLVVADDYSRYTWVFFLHSKDEASKRVRTDNGTVFKNKTLAKFFDEIHESVNVNFDEISEMASKQFSLEPGLSNINEMEKYSNLSVSQVSKTSKRDLEDLFQKFYDEYFDSSKIMKSSTTNVETSNVEIPSNEEEVFHEVSESFQGENSLCSLNDDMQQSPKDVILPQTNTQSNNMIPNVDEASTSHNVFNERLEDTYFDTTTSFHDPSNLHTFYQPYLHEKKWTKDHPLHKIIGDPKSSVRTRGQLVNSCLFSCLLSSIEPANVAEALRDVDSVSAMQEELDEFTRLKVWSLVPRPEGKTHIIHHYLFLSNTRSLLF
nr:hypothetical protein [Tanacetum cinerariifolium]